MRVCVCALMDFWGHAGLYVFAPMWLTVCMCMCVGQNGKSEPTVVSGSINRRLCAANVKFMYCAAFTKEACNGFWGKIMAVQWRDRSRERKTRKVEERKNGDR